MTLPTLPGWGDSLKDLPQLGAYLHKITNPHAEQEQMLQQIMQQKPDLYAKLIEQEKANPGSMAKAFGPKASQFLGQQNETQSQIDQKKLTDLQIKGAELGNTGAEVNIDRAKIDLLKNQNVIKHLAQNPEAMQDFLNLQTRGTAHPELEQAQATEALKGIARRADRSVLVQPIIQDINAGKINAAELAKRVVGKGGKPLSAEEAQGLWDNMPQLMDHAMAYMTQQDQLKYGRASQRMDVDEYSRRTAISDAQQEVSQAGGGGFTISDVLASPIWNRGNIITGSMPPATPQGIEAYTQFKKAQRGDLREKQVAPALIGFQKAWEATQKPGADPINPAALTGMNSNLSKIDVEVSRLGGDGTRKLIKPQAKSGWLGGKVIWVDETGKSYSQEDAQLINSQIIDAYRNGAPMMNENTSKQTNDNTPTPTSTSTSTSTMPDYKDPKNYHLFVLGKDGKPRINPVTNQPILR